MELKLTKSQKRYLDNKGVIPASMLQKAYKKSVIEQQGLKKAADKLRKAQSNKQ